MGVTTDHEVDVVDVLGHRLGDVLLEVCRVPLVALGVESGVDEGDDDLGAVLLHLRHPLLGGEDDVLELEHPLHMGLVPDPHPGRHETEHTDLDRVPVDLALDDRVGLERRRGGAGLQHVRPEERCVELVLVGLQHLEPVVELVVAVVDGVVLEHVVRLGHRVLLPPGLAEVALRQGGERRALDGVAVVEQKNGVGTPLRADVRDDGGSAAQPELVVLVVRCVCEVVPVEDVAVDIRRAEHREGRAGRRIRGRGMGGEGEQRHEGQRSDGCHRGQDAASLVHASRFRAGLPPSQCSPIVAERNRPRDRLGIRCARR